MKSKLHFSPFPTKQASKTFFHSVLITVAVLLLALGGAKLLPLSSSSAKPNPNPVALTGSSDMLTWMNSQLPADTYVAVHAEHRELGATQWTKVTDVYQPFRTNVDTTLRQVYWRKDDPSHDFYGEIFNYDVNTIELRMETTPNLSGIDPPGTWDVRPDKFRLFVWANSADHRPYGHGRPIAPRTITSSWSQASLFDTFACNSWSDFQSGACPLYQHNAHDDTSLEIIAPFSTVYDGEMEDPRWHATDEYKTFDEAVAVIQVMNHGVARERFIFARKGSAYYGIVRWDYAVPVSGTDGRVSGWFITDRTTGLRSITDATFSSAGMPGRGTYDSYQRMAGMRILQTEGKTLNCPTTAFLQRGWFSFLANSGDWYSDFYDLDFFDSHSGGTGTICVDDTKIGLTLTVASGCPPANTRGSIWVPSGQAWASVWDPTLVPITNSWVSLCAADASNHDAYLRLFPVACDPGTFNSGAFMPSYDCYDDSYRRCNTTRPGGSWMVLCSK
jgi:hypothetical protein